MSKGFKFYLIVWAICFIVFNAVTFIIPTEINLISGSFFIGYIFIVIAFVGQLCCAYIAFKEDNLQKLFYNISLMAVSYTALLAMLIAGTICMFVPLFPLWLGTILCVLIAGISAVIILLTCFVINAVSNTDNEIKTKLYTIRTLTSEAEHIMLTAKNDEIKSICKKVYGALRYSDPMSNIALSEIGEQIQRQFVVFKDTVSVGDYEMLIEIADELLVLIDKRNKQCKLSK